MRKFLWVVGILASVYLGAAYFPVARAYFIIRFEAQKVASAAKIHGTSYAQLQGMSRAIEDKTGVVVYTNDIRVKRHRFMTEVLVHARIPVRFPLLDQKIWHRVTIKTESASTRVDP